MTRMELNCRIEQEQAKLEAMIASGVAMWKLRRQANKVYNLEVRRAKA